MWTKMTRTTLGAFLGFALCLIWPSATMFKKAPTLLFLYVGFALVVLWLFTQWLLPHVERYCANPKVAIPVLTAMFLALTVAFFVIYPQIDTAGFQLFGRQFGACDCDNAIDQSMARILAGKYPYYDTTTKSYIVTFCDGHITSMPGAILLASPFYFLGCSAFQGIFWRAVFILGMGMYFRGTLIPLLVAMFTFFLSPIFVYDIFTGADYHTNATYVLIFSALLYESVNRKCHFGLSALWAALLGIGLSSRMNFMFVAPVLYLALVRMAGFRKGTLLMTFAGVAWCALTLPFYLYAPTHFTPFHTASKLGRMPLWATILSLALAILLTTYFALRHLKRESTLLHLFRDIFWIQLYFIAVNTLATSIYNYTSYRMITFAFWDSGFGVFFAFFGFVAFAPTLFAPRSRGSIAPSTQAVS